MAVDASRTVKINFIAEDQGVEKTVKDVERAIEGVGAAANKFSQRLTAQNEKLTTSGKKAERSMDAAARAWKRATAAEKEAAAARKITVSSFAAIGVGVSAFVAVAREAVQVLTELATEAIEVEQVSRNLQFGIGEAAEATEGFVDKMTLARNANKAFALGVAQDSAEFAALVGSATKIAQAQGLDAQKLVEQAVVGIGRKSAARLDDLGILLNQTKAERIYAKSLGKTAKELTILEKEEAFQKAALIEIQKAGDRAAASIDGFAVTVVKGQVTLQNAKQDMLGFDDTIGKVRESLRGMTDEELERLRFGEVADDASAAGKELNKTLEQWGVDLRDVRGAADDLGVSFQDLIKGQKELRGIKGVESVIKGVETLNQVQIKGLREQADEAEFLAKLGEANGDSQEIVNFRLLEGLKLRADAAELQFAQTQSVADEAKLLALQRDIQLAQASARAPRGGGGSGPSQAARLLASGEQRVAQMETMAKLAGIIAEDASQTADAAEFERAAAMERLQLEREALDITKARGRFAQQELANSIAANEAEQSVLRAETRAAALAREREELNTLVSIETARSANEAEAAASRLTLLGREFEAREILRQQAELELINNPPETQLEIIEQRGALAQLEFDRETDRRNREAEQAQKRDAQEEALHQAELKRIKERTQKQKAAIDASGRFLKQGQQFASAIIGVAIKDEEKRAQAELKARGIMAIATGALEVVRGAAAAASFNVVEAALHFGAAGLAFVQGGIMLAGNIPGRGSTGGAGATAAAAPREDRDTSEAARIVESRPAADGEPARQPRADQQGGGNTIIFEAGSIQGLDPTDETIETIRLGLDNVNNGLESTG